MSKATPKSARKKQAQQQVSSADAQDGEASTPPQKETPKFAKRVKRPNIPAPAALTALKGVLAELRNLEDTREPVVLSTPLRRDPDGNLVHEKNRALFGYEEALLKLLERLDALDTQGIDAVREARRNAVDAVHKRLEVLDSYKRGELPPKELMAVKVKLQKQQADHGSWGMRLLAVTLACVIGHNDLTKDIPNA
ncbi:hypothetical protein BC832DRAFT_82516 [Gaertneriomyces semiglobifer]|nr:hypothetical protein BC832DRAFT_82516 [Gaertneriomyces semiglobifer]